MNKDEEIRFKCLELAVSKTGDLGEQLARAKVYFTHVAEPPEEKQNQVSSGAQINPAKRTDNSKIAP